MEAECTFSRFEQAVAKYPQRPAVYFLGDCFTYRQLQGMVKRFAGGLASRGIKKGDRVVLYLSNCPQFVVAFLAVQKLGAATVLIALVYTTSHEIEYMVKDAGAKTIVCHDTNYGYVREIFEQTPLERIIVTNMLDLVSPGKRLVAALSDKAPKGKVRGGAETVWFKQVLKGAPLKERVAIDPVEDLSYILYTGGTTGLLKGVPGNHWGQVSYVNDITDYVFKGHVLEGQDVYIAINPLFHIMALGLFMALGLNLGNATVLMPLPQVDAILESIERYKVRWMLGVPALYRMILENDRQETYNLGSLKYCYCYYSSLDAGDPEPMCVGLPLPSRQVKVVDAGTLEEVPQGEVGELLVTSAFAVKQYLNRLDETERSFIKLNGSVYYRTSDFVRLGPDGSIFYVERSADILKHKGYRVSASEIEAILQDHPVVVRACVVGVPDKKVGERIKAIVVLKDDAEGVGATELIRYCREHLAPYKVPSYIEFRNMLPKSKVGKLLRREIRDEERRKQQGGTA